MAAGRRQRAGAVPSAAGQRAGAPPAWPAGRPPARAARMRPPRTPPPLSYAGLRRRRRR
ncbi:hypothetical protein chiPu_0031377, partial [Chiloscyllium punctatum]|nr:hypothetical protein [Chiloscyllium punctatum]